jgi:hypothetical protein
MHGHISKDVGKIIVHFGGENMKKCCGDMNLLRQEHIGDDGDA